MLKENILDGTFKQGDRLHEVKLAKLYGVSRSPVREAMIELVSEGLLESVPNKGVYVKVYTIEDIINIYEYREMLEKYAIEKVIEKIDEESIAELEKIRKQLILSFEEKNFNGYCEVDTMLHNTFFKIWGNEIAINTVKNLYPRISTFRTMSLSLEKRFEDSFVEHIDIIDGLIEKNFDKAWEATSKNLRIGRDQIIMYLESMKKKYYS